MFTVRYITIFGFFLLFVSTFLTVCYSFRLFYFVICGDFNFVPSYSMVETSYNIVFGMIGLLIISIFGGGSLMWLICPTPCIICLPYYLKFLTLFVVFVGGWFCYEIAGFVFSDNLFSVRLYSASSFASFYPVFIRHTHARTNEYANRRLLIWSHVAVFLCPKGRTSSLPVL